MVMPGELHPDTGSGRWQESPCRSGSESAACCSKVVPMLISRRLFCEFFARRTETARAGLLEEAVERAPAHSEDLQGCPGARGEPCALARTRSRAVPLCLCARPNLSGSLAGVLLGRLVEDRLVRRLPAPSKHAMSPARRGPSGTGGGPRLAASACVCLSPR
jgi:hypothetical protein